jgi:transposase-like protein
VSGGAIEIITGRERRRRWSIEEKLRIVAEAEEAGAGKRRERGALVEAAWTYRYPTRVSETLRARIEGLPKPVRGIAWKAQLRLNARYRRLSAAGVIGPAILPESGL